MLIKVTSLHSISNKSLRFPQLHPAKYITLTVYMYDASELFNVLNSQMHDRSVPLCRVNKTFTYPGLGTCQRYRRCDPVAFLCLSTRGPGSTREKQQRDEQRRENKTMSFISRQQHQAGSIIVNTIDILPGHFKGTKKPKDSLKKHSVCTKSIPDTIRTGFGTKYIKIGDFDKNVVQIPRWRRRPMQQRMRTEYRLSLCISLHSVKIYTTLRRGGGPVVDFMAVLIRDAWSKISNENNYYFHIS